MKLKYMVLLPIMLLFSTFAHAGISSMSVTVEGMACPFCAFGVEKRIKKVKGVSSVDVDMRTGKAMITAEPDASIQYRDVPQAVRDAGFTPGEMHISASGLLGKDENGSMVLGFENFSLSLKIDNNELKTQLETAMKSARPVVLNGRIFQNKAKDWIFTPETVEEPES